MRRPSIKGKIRLGFLSLALLLLISGAFSIFELARMNKTVSGMLTENINSASIARKMIVMSQNTNWTLHDVVVSNSEIVLNDVLMDELEMKKLLLDARNNLSTPGEDVVLDSIELIYGNLNNIIRNMPSASKGDRKDIYYDSVVPMYRSLMFLTTKLIQMNQNQLRENTISVENNRYRILMPGVIAVFSGLIIIILFYYFIVFYYINPLNRIIKAAENTMDAKVPFKVTGEVHYEMADLKNIVNGLVTQVKKGKAGEEQAKFRDADNFS